MGGRPPLEAGGRSRWTSLRLAPSTADAVERLVAERGQTRSEVLRAALAAGIVALDEEAATA